MLTPIEFEVEPQRPDRRSWTPLAASAMVHLLLILLLVFGIPSSNVPVTRTRGSQAVQPLAIPPEAKPFAVPPRKVEATRPEPPPPPMKEVELGPNSTKPDEPAKEASSTKQTQTEPTTTPAPPAPTPAPPPPPPTTEPPKPNPAPPAPPANRIPTPADYLGVHRIPTPTTSAFGPPPPLDSASGSPSNAAPPAPPAAGSMGRTGLSNLDPHNWENSFDDETAGRCVDVPDLGNNPDGTPVLAAVIGRVLDTDGKTPLSGAHLQIMGTTFGTFSDMRGEYRLEFDPKLLAKCRKQYVVVVAPGYRGETLTLFIGPKVRSDDVVLHHH
ncbi:MAG: hypothetical protein ACREK8_03975 [Gemmatimonadales bacterium]